MLEFALLSALLILARIEYAHHRGASVDLDLQQLAERSSRIERRYYLRCRLLAARSASQSLGEGGKRASAIKPGDHAVADQSGETHG